MAQYEFARFWPAEWEKHEATWLAWPHNVETWPSNLRAAQAEFVNFVRVLSEFELVRILIVPDQRSHARQMGLPNSKEVEWYDVPTNDAWIRDYGATVVLDSTRSHSIFVDWQYNAWGDKYPPYAEDQQVAEAMAKIAAAETWRSELTLEGGAIEGNGTGALLTTRSCVANASRNPDRSLLGIEALLNESLGVSEFVWLPGGEIEGDDTDGHIDQIARFVDETMLVISSYETNNELNQITYRENDECLREAIRSRNLNWEIVSLPLPAEQVQLHNVALPASYTNFIWANDAMILPQFDDRMDQRVVDLLQELCPRRKVIGCQSRELLAGLGAWHCLSQQQPLVPKTENDNSLL